jgi:hypothetical protein
MGSSLAVRVAANRSPLADALCQFDDDPFRASDVAEPVAIRVVDDFHYFADKFRASRAQSRDNGVNVLYGESYMSDAQRVRWQVLVTTPSRRRVEFRQLEPPVAVLGLQHRNVRTDAIESHNAIHPMALDRRLSLQFESKFDEELSCCREVINNDADVLHPINYHLLYRNRPSFGSSDARPGEKSNHQLRPVADSLRSQRCVCDYSSPQRQCLYLLKCGSKVP